MKDNRRHWWGFKKRKKCDPTSIKWTVWELNELGSHLRSDVESRENIRKLVITSDKTLGNYILNSLAF